ncbi:MAG: DUF1826 domain-containing protein [Deltaproteobacteria bacterium]
MKPALVLWRPGAREIPRRPASRVVFVEDEAELAVLFEPSVVLAGLRVRPVPAEELTALTARDVPDVQRPTAQPGRSIRARVSTDGDVHELATLLGSSTSSAAVTQLADAVRLFADLSGAREVGLRLAIESRPSCPRFHVDQVALRAVGVWLGPTTEWVDDRDILDRTKLGHGSRGAPDERSGLLRPGAVVQQLAPSMLAFFKGEAWPGMAGRALVHRSPACDGQVRILWTLDALD